MNRLKVWLFVLLAVAAAAVTLRAHAVQLRARERAHLDARLTAAGLLVAASSRALAVDTAAAAAIAARDPRLAAAVSPPAPAPARGRRGAAPAPGGPRDPAIADAVLRGAARVALDGAEAALGRTLPAGTLVTAATAATLPHAGDAGAGEAGALLRRAIAGVAASGHVRVSGALFLAAAAPAGRDAGLLVLVPVGEAWVKGAATAAGTPVTLVAPDVKLVSTAAAPDAQALVPWTHGADVPAALGQLGPVNVAVGSVALPPLPPLLGEEPALRARAVTLHGVKDAFAVVSLPSADALGPVLAFEWEVTLGLAAVLLVGLLVGLAVRAPEAAPVVPEELHAAAARIAEGDFAARAPALAGKLGTVASALNRAAELAGPAAAVATARAPEPAPEEAFGRPLAAAEPPPASEAPVAPEPAPEPPTASPEPASAVAPAAGLLQAAALAAPPATVAVDEETHWQQVFQDFLRTRSSCGEATEGLTYEKFRVKLEGNRSALVAKYACKSVKFQVYVKEGKAALKATPVK